MPEELIDPTDTRDHRVQDLITGTVQPPNEVAAYFVRKIQVGLAQGQDVARKLSAARTTVAQLEQEALRLEGQVHAHVQDLKAWDKPTTPPKGEHKEMLNETPS